MSTTAINELKNAQEELKKQIEELDIQIAQKETRGEVNYDIIETKSLVKKLIKENEKIAQKIDYLLAILTEAAEETEDTSLLDSVKTLLKTQTEVIDYLSKIAEKNFNVDLSPILHSMDDLRAKVNAVSQNIMKLMDRLPESSQIELLKTKLDEVSQKLSNIEAVLNTPKESHLSEVHEIHRELQELKNESEIISSKLNQLIEANKQDRSQELFEKINLLAGKMNLLEAEIVRKKELIEKMCKIEDEIQNILKNYRNVDSSSFDDVIRKIEEIRKEIPETETTQTFHKKLEEIANKILAYKKRKENSEKINQVLSEIERSIQEGDIQKLEQKTKELEDLLIMEREIPIIKRIEELEERIDRLSRIKEQVAKPSEKAQTKQQPPVQKIEKIHEQTIQEKTQIESKFSIVDQFINQMVPGKGISIPELAEHLGMDVHELEDYLIDLSQRRDDIKLKNFGFLAKLLHKDHMLVKVK